MSIEQPDDEQRSFHAEEASNAFAERRLEREFTLRRIRLAHRHKMEAWRLAIASALVAVLFGVLVIGLFRDVSGQDINQFATPISGLAGIALGWIFAQRGPDGSGREEDVEAQFE